MKLIKNSPCSRYGVGIYINERYLSDEDNIAASDEFIEQYYFDTLKNDIVVFENFMIKKFNMYKKKVKK